SATSASASPGASGLRSTATTRSPSSFARRIAPRWCRPAPTKRTVFPSTGAMLLGVDSLVDELQHGLDVDLGAARDLEGNAVEDHVHELRQLLDRHVRAQGVPFLQLDDAPRRRTAARPSGASWRRARARSRPRPAARWR